MPRDREGDDVDAPSLLQQLAGVNHAEKREESRMTGNESDPFAERDPDRAVFDSENVFGTADQGAGDGSTDGRDESDIWGPLRGDVSADHSTQVLESDAFGRPFVPEPVGDPFGSADASDQGEPDPWARPDFGGQGPAGQELWPQGDPSSHVEHEVPPPWEFESGGGPGAEPPTWHPTPREQPWQPAGADQESWQPAPSNGQPEWQAPGFDPFAPPPGGQQHPWAPNAGGGTAQAPGFDPFAPPPSGRQGAGAWGPEASSAQPPPPYAPGADQAPFGPPDSFSTPADESGARAAPYPDSEVPNPFGPTDSAPSPFDAAPFAQSSAPEHGDAASSAEQPADLASFWPPETPDGGEPAQAQAQEQAPFWQPAADEDGHATDRLQRPDDSGQFGRPWAPPAGQPDQPPAPWGPWPGEGHQSPQPPTQQPGPPRYDLSQFQHGYQPPQQPPQHPSRRHGPPQPGYGFAGYPGQPGPEGQYPGMAAPMPLPPQPPIPLTSDNLAPQELLRPRKPAPTGGWRRAVFKVSGGLIDPGESNKEIQRQQMVSLIRTPVAGGHYRVAVLSLKGGVGKTTTTVGLGSTLATLRGDRVIAVDANPDRGTLSEKVRLETRANVRDLLATRESVQRYSDVRQYTSQSASRLEVLASDPDPAISEAFSEDDYRAAADVLEHYYSICLTDCGTGLLHSAMRGVLGLADQIVLVSSASVDGARSASATLDWLDAHDYGDLVCTGVVVMSAVRPQNKAVDLSRLEQHFSARCRALVRIPFDPHLEAGAEFVLEQLNSGTSEAYLELTAAVAAGFQHRLPR